MQKMWKNLNVDLKALTGQIASYLESWGYEEITAVEEGEGYRITGEAFSKDKRLNGALVVVAGEPNQFTLTLQELKEQRFNFPVILSAMFGGGYFLLRSLKSSESWLKFENGFWRSITSIVEQSRDSADSFKKPVP